MIVVIKRIKAILLEVNYPKKTCRLPGIRIIPSTQICVPDKTVSTTVFKESYYFNMAIRHKIKVNWALVIMNSYVEWNLKCRSS